MSRRRTWAVPFVAVAFMAWTIGSLSAATATATATDDKTDKTNDDFWRPVHAAWTELTQELARRVPESLVSAIAFPDLPSWAASSYAYVTRSTKASPLAAKPKPTPSSSFSFQMVFRMKDAFGQWVQDTMCSFEVRPSSVCSPVSTSASSHPLPKIVANVVFLIVLALVLSSHHWSLLHNTTTMFQLCFSVLVGFYLSNEFFVLYGFIVFTWGVTSVYSTQTVSLQFWVFSMWLAQLLPLTLLFTTPITLCLFTLQVWAILLAQMYVGIRIEGPMTQERLRRGLMRLFALPHHWVFFYMTYTFLSKQLNPYMFHLFMFVFAVRMRHRNRTTTNANNNVASAFFGFEELERLILCLFLAWLLPYSSSPKLYRLVIYFSAVFTPHPRHIVLHSAVMVFSTLLAPRLFLHSILLPAAESCGCTFLVRYWGHIRQFWQDYRESALEHIGFQRIPMASLIPASTRMLLRVPPILTAPRPAGWLQDFQMGNLFYWLFVVMYNVPYLLAIPFGGMHKLYWQLCTFVVTAAIVLWILIAFWFQHQDPMFSASFSVWHKQGLICAVLVESALLGTVFGVYPVPFGRLVLHPWTWLTLAKIAMLLLLLLAFDLVVSTVYPDVGVKRKWIQKLKADRRAVRAERVDVDSTNVLESSCRSFLALDHLWPRERAGTPYNTYVRLWHGGVQQQGLDAGGLTKEWITLFCENLINEKNHLFRKANESNFYIIHPLVAYAKPICGHRQEPVRAFRWIGRFLGTVLYNSAILPIRFHPFVYRMILGESITSASHDDLQLYDPNLARQLAQLARFSSAELEALDMQFVRSEQLEEQKINNMDIPLKTGGENVDVTRKNVDEYVSLYRTAVFGLNREQHYQELREGVLDVIPSDVLHLFSPQELQCICAGENTISVAQWKKNTSFGAGVSAAVQHLFWTCVEEMSQQQRKDLFYGVTASANLPYGGFAALEPRFHVVPTQASVPKTHTCFNRLDLPQYKTRLQMMAGLVLLIEHNRGFGNA